MLTFALLEYHILKIEVDYLFHLNLRVISIKLNYYGDITDLLYTAQAWLMFLHAA